MGKVGFLTAFTKAVAMYGLLYLLMVPDAIALNRLWLPVLIDFFFTVFLIIGIRVVMLFVYDWMWKKSIKPLSRILIYGNSNKSVAVKTRLQKSEHYEVIGFINYGNKSNTYRIAELRNFPFSDESEFDSIIEKNNINAILFTSNADVMIESERLILYCERYKEHSIRTLIAPQVDEFIGNQIDTGKNKIRDVRIEDLLGREEINISMDKIRATLSGKRILVTGAAGSIGSELCRQLASFDIEQLILFDNAETPIHTLRLELEKSFPKLKFVPMIGDVRRKERLDVAFRKYRPQVVFHAAAYKHVPLMEENPCEAVAVNVAGSRNVVDKCIEYCIEKMVMISTDKAVNPTNIMGCTKRLAEIYVQSLGTVISCGKVKCNTKFVTTRFGNVLGSNGSVIPLFRQQIESGGPVTVTHPEITRYFMTIPEACRLVMEAATISDGNQIMVFDMGESVKITELATRMINLAGLTVGKDIQIEYTGLRPGEKLYEEVLSNVENTLPTSHDRIRIASVREYDYEKAKELVGKLENLAIKYQIEEMVRLMLETVPEYKPQNSEFEKLVCDENI
jgi:FlaA1/EpsC-like NDP-sugar epimerase